MPIHKKATVSNIFDELHRGEEFRKKYAREEKWPYWRAMYRGDWNDETLPVNLFFMLIRSTVPRIYFRNPGISVTPAMTGTENAVFAQLLERVDNKLIKMMGMKKQMKKLVQDAFMLGTGIFKVGFGAEFTPTPPADEFRVDVSAPTRGKSGEALEYNSKIKANMPWIKRVQPANFVVPDETEDLDDASWCAHKVTRPVEDVRHDPRFKHRQKINPTYPSASDIGLEKQVYRENVDLYEIQDKKNKRVMVVTEDVNQPLLDQDDLFQQLHGFKYFPICFNEDDEVFWGIPDSQILEPRQLELNEIKTQTMKHRRLAIAKWFARRGVINEEEAAKMLSEDVGSVVDVDGNPYDEVREAQASNIPQDLIQAGELTMNDVREELGFSRNQFGEYHPKTNTTATESRIVQEAVDIRIDERRDLIADQITEAFKLIHSLIFKLWDVEIVMDVVGPGGIPMWIRFSPAMLANGAYRLDINPDTATPETREMREAKAIEVYQIFKENPLVDPVELTRYLLREMHGVEYDNLMRGMPPRAGATQQRALNIGQYTNILNRAGPLGLPIPAQLGT